MSPGGGFASAHTVLAAAKHQADSARLNARDKELLFLFFTFLSHQK
jgi:hypothetical protein